MEDKMTKENNPDSSKTLQDFEEKLSELEGLVQEMDSEAVSLDESLKKFEKGVKLYKECYASLSYVEKKIQVLSESLEVKDYESTKKE